MSGTALVTGGGGFIGGAVARALVGRGRQVRSLSRGEYPALKALGIEHVSGDLADGAAVEAAARGCDLVVHVAARAGVWGPAAEYERTNVDGTRKVIDACRKHGVPRLVFTSSPSVVFDGSDQEGVEESAPYPAPDRFLADYPRTKAEAEKLVRAAHGPDLATVSLRPHLVWGPGDHHLVPRILERARSGKLKLVADDRSGTGNPRKVDATFIDNVVDAHLAAIDALDDPARRDRCGGQAYFITNGEPWPIADVINGILRAAGLPPVTRTVSPAVAYAAGIALETVWRWMGRRDEPVMTRFVARQLATAHWFDIRAAQRDLGWSPRVSMAEGFRRLAESFQNGGRAS